jgi:hypothetical protein
MSGSPSLFGGPAGASTRKLVPGLPSETAGLAAWLCADGSRDKATTTVRVSTSASPTCCCAAALTGAVSGGPARSPRILALQPELFDRVACGRLTEGLGAAQRVMSACDVPLFR